MKYLIALLVLGLAGCATYTSPAPTVANYTGGQYDESGNALHVPYNAPYGSTGGAGAQ